ncbi:nuclear transport factor 2 family protein [Novosphingobium sp. 1949]|uniref:Nuclear transport factor 2 family protein n=1 Tax=Novosphingobium organovorum TaxID=2930092 RepID=A0ABT0B9R0_9SPHN|nr:nuclear transport factor 2 family protein [Novosphingobium organovorum]MCJ2181796.1 nuclear transport factor 2 family protein [Novosphingobium organovorum]
MPVPSREDYQRYIAAFNARDYAALEAFFTDDFVLENAGFAVRGKEAFRRFYAFFHAYCRETVRLCGYYPGQDGFVANVVIAFEGLQDLSAQVLAAHGYTGMAVVPQGARVEVEFLILYRVNAQGLIDHIKGAVWIPEPAPA